MSYQLNSTVEDVDKSMRTLRESMKGIQIRRAGFKKHHDDLARAVATFTVNLVDAKALLSKDAPHKRRR